MRSLLLPTYDLLVIGFFSAFPSFADLGEQPTAPGTGGGGGPFNYIDEAAVNNYIDEAAVNNYITEV